MSLFFNVSPAFFAQAVLAYLVSYSLRFDDTNDYMSLSVPDGDRTKWTWSAWVKIADPSTRTWLFSGGPAGDLNNLFYTMVESSANGNSFKVSWRDGSQTTRTLDTNASYDQTDKWYHFVLVVDTAQSLTTNKMKLYVDGVDIDTTASQYTTDNRANLPASPTVNQAGVIVLGTYAYNVSSTTARLNGQLAEVHFVDGTAYDASYFGEYNSDGVWLPKQVTGVTYGNNGFYLDFADSSTVSALGTDASTNNNNFSVEGNITPDDQLLDTPNLRFATWDPDTLTHVSGTGDLTESNLKWVGTVGNDTVFASEAKSSGKWYYEAYLNSNSAQAVLGWSTTAERDVTSPIVSAQAAYFITAGIRKTNTTVVWNSTTGNDGQSVTIANNDVFGFAIDISSGTLDIYRNGTLITSPALTLPSNKGTEFLPIIGDASSTDSTITANFGQDHTFAGQKSALLTPYSDANGVGEFYYQPPSGFLALATEYK